jgi:tRNA modification GTPase
VVRAVLGALAAIPGLRAAEPGAFTRRAFENGRIDLAEAEGLADLLEAETEAQRRNALAMAGGALGRRIDAWQARLLAASARVEAGLDFSDEGEIGEAMPAGWGEDLRDLAREMVEALARPGAERLREGVRTVIAGPPNSGKSSLLNSLAGREAAITSATAGTTRDLVEAPTGLGGMPFLLVDTAGLREAEDEIEGIGIGRAHDVIAAADLILWLGAPGDCPDQARAILVQSKIDLAQRDPAAEIHVSAETGQGMADLIALLIERARALLPGQGEIALNARHRAAIAASRNAIGEAIAATDFLIAAESLRLARAALDGVTGRAGVEDMLDTLFGRFCIGK